MTKRKFLTILGGALAGIVSLKFLRPQFRSFADQFRPQLSQLPARAVRPTDSALDQLVALGEVLVDDRDLSTEEKEAFRTHIHLQIEIDSRYGPLYENTADFLRGLAGGDFAALPRERRVQLALQNRLTSFRVGRKECLLPWGRTQRLVRLLAVPDLIFGYYSSAPGWAVVRYSSFPGQCGDLARYTRADA